MKKILNKKIIILAVITAFFVILMISFSFPDLFAMFYVPNMIGKGNIYSLVRLNKNICPWLDATWPPLYYLTIGSYLNFLKFFKIIPSSIFSVNQCPIWELILNKNFLFWAKLPFLILHFLSAIFFSKFFNKNRFLWFLLWLLNPIVIFITFIQGQFDIIPTFFFILALYFTYTKKPYLVFLALGIGAAYKFYPFLLVPVFILYFSRDIKKQAIYILLSIAPYLLTALPFFNKDYLSFLAFSENYKMLQQGLQVGPIKLSYYLITYIVLLLIVFINKKISFSKLIQYCFLFLSIYYVFTPNWFVQRALFITPILLLLSAFNKNIAKSLPFLYLAFFGYVLIFFPGLFDQNLLRPILSIKNINYLSWPIDQLKIIILGVMGGIYIYLISVIMTKHQEKKVDVGYRDILGPFVCLLIYLITIVTLYFISFYS